MTLAFVVKKWFRTSATVSLETGNAFDGLRGRFFLECWKMPSCLLFLPFPSAKKFSTFSTFTQGRPVPLPRDQANLLLADSREEKKSLPFVVGFNIQGERITIRLCIPPANGLIYKCTYLSLCTYTRKLCYMCYRDGAGVFPSAWVFNFLYLFALLNLYLSMSFQQVDFYYWSFVAIKVSESFLYGLCEPG